MKVRIGLLPLVVLLGLTAGSNRAPAHDSLSSRQWDGAVAGVNDNDAWTPLVRSLHGVRMALVPAGCFTMGTTTAQLAGAREACSTYYGAFGCEYSFADEQPAHVVCLREPYWIDVVPVSNRQYRRMTGSVWPSPYGEPALPLQAIPWDRAAHYCALRGGRLPTEAEWEYAARGPASLIFPYGNQFDLRLTTLRKTSPPRSGQLPQGASWVGAQDMSGGMAEWVLDWYGLYSAARQVDPLGPSQGSKRILRGGDWFAHSSFLVRSAIREPVDPGFATSKNGVRCAMDAPGRFAVR